MATNDLFQIIRGQVMGSNGIPVMRDIRVWVGTTNTTSGSWSVDYALAGFTEVLHIVVTPLPSSSTSTSDSPLASLRGYNKTSANGIVVQNTLLGFGLFRPSSAVKLFVQVYGY